MTWDTVPVADCEERLSVLKWTRLGTVECGRILFSKGLCFAGGYCTVYLLCICPVVIPALLFILFWPLRLNAFTLVFLSQDKDSFTELSGGLVMPAWLRQTARRSCLSSQAGTANQMLSPNGEQHRPHYVYSVSKMLHMPACLPALTVITCIFLRNASGITETFHCWDFCYQCHITCCSLFSVSAALTVRHELRWGE